MKKLSKALQFLYKTWSKTGCCSKAFIKNGQKKIKLFITTIFIQFMKGLRPCSKALLKNGL